MTADQAEKGFIQGHANYREKGEDGERTQGPRRAITIEAPRQPGTWVPVASGCARRPCARWGQHMHAALRTTEL